MSAVALSIGRYRGRAVVPRSRRAEGDRLLRLQHEALGEPLSAALALAGFQPEQLVLVRSLRVRLSTSAGWTDRAVVRGMAEVVAGALVKGRARGEVVVYDTRADAFLDLARAVSRGNAGRAWVWHHLGWQPDTGEAPAADTLATALLERPREIVPLLARAVEEPGVRDWLATSFAADRWRSLVRAALVGTGLSPRLLEGVAPPAAARGPAGRRAARGASAPAPSDRDPSERGGSAALGLEVHVARGIAGLERSSLARDLAPYASDGGGGLSADLLVLLALLQADPALLADHGAAARARPSWARSLLEGPRRSPRPRPRVHSSPTGDRPMRDGAPAAGPPREPGEPGGAGAPPLAATAREAAEATLDAAQPPQVGERTGELGGASRSSGATRFGGLLFLLHLVDSRWVREELPASPLGVRSLRWTLHRLAGLLAPEAPLDDPARLAFCGLGPGDEPPAEGEPEPSEAEAAALAALARELAERLRVRLGRPRRAAATTLAEVVSRSATVVADPGWIELRMSLREVDTGVRRAGLDCDPDYLPWLGVVVRFRYA